VASSSLGVVPARWVGDLPGGDGRVRWQLDLAADGTFQLRQKFLNRPAPNRYDDIGRWQLEPNTPRLALRGGREAPVYFQPLAGDAALQMPMPRSSWYIYLRQRLRRPYVSLDLSPVL
jgi:hypothetical protein